MSLKIDHVITKDNPEVKIQVGIFESQNSKENALPIIIVPGWLSAIDNFAPMAEALQKYRTAIIYEPRGFGKSLTPHKKGLFSPEEYNNELGRIIEHLKLKDREFLMLGSCSGASQMYSYYLDGEGSKPIVLAAFNSQEKYKMPFFIPVLGVIPTFVMKFVQKMIIVIYGFILKLKKTGESPNVTWAKNRLKLNDDWSLRRHVIEFTNKYDIVGRQKEIDVPIITFTAEKDHFVNPEISKKFISHKDSELVTLKTELHRIHEGREQEIAEYIQKFIEKLKL
ncbi:MAG: alpha/beta hydrolase [Candidatus Heimdallarchaeota archaeon]|nr:alpha/beta hydrolase [Candidatus Heimdallarchaeota archaeon]